MKRVVSLSWLLLAGLVPFSGYAVENVTINGFLTAGATYGDSDVGTQDGRIGNEVDFVSDSKIGIQLAADINPRISVTSQLFARGSDDAYDMKAEWAFLTYKVNDPVSLRVGKIKLTTFLISDYFDVGYAYPWVRPPMEVYSTNPISTISGTDMLLRFNIGDNQLLVQPYFGVSHGEEALVPQEVLGLMPGPPTPGDVIFTEFDADKMRGINVALSSNIFTVRAGYLKTLVGADAFGVEGEEAEFASVGATLDWKNVVVYTEYFERDVTGTAQLAFPDQKGNYITLGYRTGRLLTHVTQAKIEDNDSPTTVTIPVFGPFALTPLEQKSTTLGFRYELGAGAAMKLEFQRMTPEAGTRGLLTGNPNATGLKDPSEDVNIYSFAIDVVF
ncbi:MAG: hypothetical protein BMS9Abin33_0181 [Gammaproteobacteria bacterium]|nr:MAG: hypothetical protein BMS9Abin33_0181 [Gammaproteobacteria bacterium]